MMPSPSANRVGRWGLLLLLVIGGGFAASSQPTAETTARAPSTIVVRPAPAPVPSNWPWVLGVLGGIALGVLGARWWARWPSPKANELVVPAPEPVKRKRAENVVRVPASPAPDRASPPARPTNAAPKSAGASGKTKNKSRTTPSAPRSSSWPTVAHRSTTMSPTPPVVPSTPAEERLETGQSMEWSAPVTTPLPIQEMIEASAGIHAAESSPGPTVPAGAEAAAVAETAPPAALTGPVHYYAPAPDVPSIEHRKLSPNPLPQMPLLIILPQAEATTAQFSFSPQADQSRIIGNGMRELKEFFAFELPPTERFTAIENLAAGQLEKRDDVWHVVRKARIALR